MAASSAAIIGSALIGAAGATAISAATQKKPKLPGQQTPPSMPAPDDELMKKNAQKDAARRSAERGRASTFLSSRSGGSDKMGG